MLATSITKSIKRVRKFLKKRPKNPSPEKVHDVRTSTRRLESILDLLTIGKPKKHLLKDLPALHKRCGKVRDMDVLTGLASSVQARPEDKQCLVELLEYLGSERSKQVKKLRKVVKRDGPSLRRELAMLSKKIDRLARSPAKDPFNTTGQKTSTLAQLASELTSPARLSKQNLHPYRLKVKELHYALQLSDQANQAELVKKLQEVKDAIGEWHDWEELVAIAADVLDEELQLGLVRQLKKISEKKFAHALTVTNELRSSYVHVKDGQRKSKVHAMPFPISVARSAMQAS
jgi:CHAD domain-containing protein